MDLLAPVGSLLSAQLDLIREIGRNIAGESGGPPVSNPQTRPAKPEPDWDTRLPQGPSPSTATLQDQRAMTPAGRPDAAATLIGLRRPASEAHLPGQAAPVSTRATPDAEVPNAAVPGDARMPASAATDLPARSEAAASSVRQAGDPPAGRSAATRPAASGSAPAVPDGKGAAPTVPGDKEVDTGGTVNARPRPDGPAGLSRTAGATAQLPHSSGQADGMRLAIAPATSNSSSDAAPLARRPGETANAPTPASVPSDHAATNGSRATPGQPVLDTGHPPAALRGSTIEGQSEPATLAALIPADVAKALSGGDLQGSSAMLERALASLVLAGGAGAAGATGAVGAMPERAGILASFILNAHFLPGWPPPRPIQQPEAKVFAQQLAPTAKLSQSEIEMLKYLANLGFTKEQIMRLMKLLRRSKQRSKLLDAISAFVVTLGTLVTMLQEEVEALAEELRAGDRLAQQTSAGKRARIELR